MTEVGAADLDASEPIAAIDAASDGANDVATVVVDVDTDEDGLCDDTEQRRGTDANKADSDDDGIPDVNEVRSGFAPLDPASPGVDQLTFIQEEPGSSVELEVDIWVQGMGDAHTGVIEAGEAVAANGLTAADFNTSVLALAADPEDHAFDIDPGSARFGAVHGETRLSFVLGFAFTDQSAAGCVRGFPFRFGVKRPDENELVGERLYLLVVLPPRTTAEQGPWCKPEECI